VRCRPNNPDAVDLSMRGWTESFRPNSKRSEDAAVGLFERALAIDPQLVPAMVGLAQTLVTRVRERHSSDPKTDIARAEEWAERAVVAEPDNAAAHVAKAKVFAATRQWSQATAEAAAAINDDPNNADAHAAFRLSPRDPLVPSTQFQVCHLHAHLAHWEQAIEWCNRAITGAPENWFPLVDFAAANAFTGREKEAKQAAVQLQKLYPGFTVQTWMGMHFSDDPTFNAQYARMAEGLRKAGVPEQ
jgi:adenylate cyclase